MRVGRRRATEREQQIVLFSFCIVFCPKGKEDIIECEGFEGQVDQGSKGETPGMYIVHEDGMSAGDEETRRPSEAAAPNMVVKFVRRW